MQSILNPGLLLLQFCFGPRPDESEPHRRPAWPDALAASPVVIGIGGSNLTANLLDTSRDLGGGSALAQWCTCRNRSRSSGPPGEQLRLPRASCQDLSSRLHRWLARQCLGALLCRSPYPGALTAATCNTTQLVDDQRRQGFTGDVFRDDQERLLAFMASSSSGTKVWTESILSS